MPSSRSQSDSVVINPGPDAKSLDRIWYLMISATVVSWAFISWMKWPDIITDYPISLYIAWRLTEGDVLYRDFHYLYGPLSPYLNAGIFALVGTGIAKLAWFHLCLVSWFIVFTFKLFRKLSDSHTSGFCALTLVMLFTFAHYFKGGFNLICPYQYETTHGLILSMLGCYLFLGYLEKPSPKYLYLLGFLTGLIYLTKVEVFLAWILCQAAGWGILFYSKSIPGLRPRGLIVPFGVSFLVPLLGFAIYFSRHMPLSKAVEVLTLPYQYVIFSPIPSLPLYRWLMGLDPLGANLIRIAYWITCLAIISGLAILCNHFQSKNPGRAPWVLAIWGSCFSGIAFYFFNSIPWLDFLSGIQLAIAMYCVWVAGNLSKQIREGRLERNLLGEWVLAIFSLALLSKVFLNISAHHFGFFLVVPATLLTVKILLHNLPGLGQKLSGNGDSLKPLMMVFLAVVLIAHGALNFKHYQNKGQPVGWEMDRVYDYYSENNPRGLLFQEMLKFMKLNIAPGETLAVLPAGGHLFNYFLKVKNPVPQSAIIPWDHYLLKPEALHDALVKEPPDWILFMKVRFEGMGLEFFGDDFGKDAVAFISRNYTPVYKVGNPFYTDNQFGIQALHLRIPLKASPEKNKTIALKTPSLKE